MANVAEIKTKLTELNQALSQPRAIPAPPKIVANLQESVVAVQQEIVGLEGLSAVLPKKQLDKKANELLESLKDDFEQYINGADDELKAAYAALFPEPEEDDEESPPITLEYSQTSLQDALSKLQQAIDDLQKQIEEHDKKLEKTKPSHQEKLATNIKQHQQDIRSLDEKEQTQKNS